MKRSAAVVETIDLEPFTPAYVEVIVARRKSKETWHLVTLRAHQTRRDRSGVSTTEEQRLASASSGVKAIQQLEELSKERAAMSVEPPGDGNSLFRSVCPTHGPIRSNSTVEYALESAYWHSVEKHAGWSVES